MARRRLHRSQSGILTPPLCPFLFTTLEVTIIMLILLVILFHFHIDLLSMYAFLSNTSFCPFYICIHIYVHIAYMCIYYI